MEKLVRKFAKFKSITLVFLKEVDRNKLEKYGKLVEFEPLKARFEVEREKVPEMAGKLLKNFPVDDVDIAETPIEEIIRQVFEGKEN